mgnify:CR=1 FL=1
MDIEQSVVENLRKSVNDNGVNSQKENKMNIEIIESDGEVFGEE